MTKDNEDSEREEYVYVLEYLPDGHSEDRVDDDTLIQGIGTRNFTLLEVLPKEDAHVKIADYVYVGDGDREVADRVKQRIEFDDLTQGARKELEYAVEDILHDDERRFVDFFNDADSVTIRLHQLDLLPGVGEKIRNALIEEREFERFDSYDDLEERVDGLHNPDEILQERIVDELKDEDVKYKLFVR